MRSLAELKVLSLDRNVDAMRHVIREGETSQTDDAYHEEYGGRFWDSLAAHPYAGQSAPPGKAFGAYQFIPHTWQWCQSVIGPPDPGEDDMSPPRQDLGATALLERRGALDDVIAGNLGAALGKLADEWPSLPGMGYARAARAFGQFGGVVSGAETIGTPATPIEQETPQTARGGKMDPLTLLGIFGPIISSLIPQVGKLFGGQKDKQNVATVGTILQTIVDAAGTAPAPGAPLTTAAVGAAVDKMQADPAVRKEVAAAVVTHPEIMPLLEIVEVGGGAAGAREADVKARTLEAPFWKTSAVFWVSVLLLPLVYWLVGSLIVGGVMDKLDAVKAEIPSWVRLILAMFGNAWNGESRSGGFNLVIGLVLGGICGVYYGISVTQNKQQQQANVEKSA